MRAKFVNEEFQQESDPIKDMNIGIKPLYDQLEDLCDSNLYTFDELFNETDDPFVVEISGTIDHPMSGYNRRFQEIDVDGTVTLDPDTRKVTIDVKTDQVNGDMIKEGGSSYYEDEDEDEDWDDDDDEYDERDYGNADHEKGEWKQEFKDIEDFVAALEDAAA